MGVTQENMCSILYLLLSILINKQDPVHAFLQFDRGLIYTVKSFRSLDKQPYTCTRIFSLFRPVGFFIKFGAVTLRWSIIYE